MTTCGQNMQTNDLMKLAASELERFLGAQLPALSSEWWRCRVFDRLSFQQQRFADERKQTELKDLDFAALLRVVDQNWQDLAERCSLPKEGRSWLKELQSVRNKWAHQSAQEAPRSEVDTLGKVLAMIGARIPPQRRSTRTSFA